MTLPWETCVKRTLLAPSIPTIHLEPNLISRWLNGRTRTPTRIADDEDCLLLGLGVTFPLSERGVARPEEEFIFKKTNACENAANFFWGLLSNEVLR